MTNQRHISKPPNPLLWLLLSLFMLKSALAADLVFEPATPIVEVGQEIALSVSGTSGEITWAALKGQIQGAGNQVTYIAPTQAGKDVVTVLDEVGNAGTTQAGRDVVTVLDEVGNAGTTENIGTVKITVTPKQLLWQENANWEVFTNRSEIQTILLSDDGKTLWVGTKGGLEQRNASTGKLVGVFTNVDGLPNNEIDVLENDGMGGLWIGTEDGLAYRSVTGDWTVYTTDNSSLPSNRIHVLESDASGGLWIGMDSEWSWSDVRNGLAYRSVTGEWTVYTTNNSGLPANNIIALESDGRAGVWIKSFQLYEEDSYQESYKQYLSYRSVNGDWIVYTTDNFGLRINKIDTLKSDGHGGLWMTYEGNLVHRSVNGELMVYTTKNSGLPSKIRALESDGRGGLWIKSSEGLAYRAVSGEWMVYTKDNSDMPSSTIDALESDSSGGLWISYEEGLAYLGVNGKWTNYMTDFSGLPSNRIQALESDGLGGLWIGTNKGLAYRNVNGKWTVYTRLPFNSISGLESDGNRGGLWIGGFGLVYRSVNGEWTHYTTDNSGLPSNHVVPLKIDESGGLWMVTDKGLAYRTVTNEWTSYEVELPDYKINALEFDSSWGLWIGTSFVGLAYYSNEWTVYTKDNSGLPSNSIFALESDGSGGLWIGTKNASDAYDAYHYGRRSASGLTYRSANGKWTVYTKDNSGLPDYDIRALETDDSGGLWIGTDGDGLTHLTFGQKNTLCTHLNDADCQNVLTDKRAAILIHPRGQGNGYKQDASILFMATHAYRVLHNRGYDNDEIYFLSHKSDVDFNGDGKPDDNIVDGPVTISDRDAGIPSRDLTHADVEQAFDWAKQKGKLDQPLLVIFVDHALPGQLRLDPFTEVLTAQDLNTQITDYQQATGSEVVVILEACHTGSLVNGLAGPNRLIITSAAENQAYYEDMGMFSFSKFFFDNLRRGESFYDAFQTVSGKLPTYGHPFNQQIPQLDDDGDGLANNSTDGRLAQKWCLNGCFGALSGEITLEPETLSGPVTAGQSTPLLVRAGITEGRIKQVRALVMTPEVAKKRNEEGFALIPTPVVNLTQKADDPSRWQGAFSGFQYRGDYVVTFMAEDNEGFITSAAPIVFTQAEGPDVPESEFIAGPDPIPSQTVYQAGEQLRVTLPALPANEKQYIAVSYPDQSLYFMTGLNGFVLFDGSSVPVWEDNSGKVAIEQPVTAFPKGEYIVYLLRLPAWIDLLSHTEEWRIGFSTFRVE